MRIERLQLLVHCVYNIWVGMTYGWYVIVHIQICFAILVIDIHSFTSDDFDWRLVEQFVGGPQIIFTTLDDATHFIVEFVCVLHIEPVDHIPCLRKINWLKLLFFCSNGGHWYSFL